MNWPEFVYFSIGAAAGITAAHTIIPLNRVVKRSGVPFRSLHIRNGLNLDTMLLGWSSLLPHYEAEDIMKYLKDRGVNTESVKNALYAGGSPFPNNWVDMYRMSNWRKEKVLRVYQLAEIREFLTKPSYRRT